MTNPIECPIDAQDILNAMLRGHFKWMLESELRQFGIEYEGYVWRPIYQPGKYTVIVEHNPGGLRIKVTNGEQVWTSDLEHPSFNQIA